MRVLVNEEDPVKARLVDDRISSLVTEANLRISEQVTQISANYLSLLLEGGEFSLLGQTFNILGLRNSQRILEALRSELPAGSSFAGALDQVIQFSRLARQNLNLANPLLGAVAHPIEVEKEVVSGSPPSLDSFAISVAATVTLMFVTVLLVAGSLALEREENAFPRLTRGLVGRTALLVEKVGLGVALSVVVTLLMLAGLSSMKDRDLFPLSKREITPRQRGQRDRRHPATVAEPPAANRLRHPRRRGRLLARVPGCDLSPEALPILAPRS